jgi:mannose-6-phosphate isomerase-like protein (cupin superfamily)
MIEKIYSKVPPGPLIHMIIRFDQISEQRTDVCDPLESLQVAAMRIPEGKVYRAHKHMIKSMPRLTTTQETWIVMRGRIKVTYYDIIGNDIIDVAFLNEGDCTITLLGGHSYEVVEDAIVYEVKSGPYKGRELDKMDLV